VTFRLTEKQQEANRVLASPATHLMLFGGSRSGKTFLAVRAMVVRALKAAGSRHAILRFRFNAVKASIVYDTFPKVMELCFPDVRASLNKSDWFAEFGNGSQIWFGGLDDKERTEKILGQEYVTIFLNECSQIPWASRNIAVTRLAQKAVSVIEGRPPVPLPLKMYYDENPPDKGHWTYRYFVQRVDPETRQTLSRLFGSTPKTTKPTYRLATWTRCGGCLVVCSGGFCTESFARRIHPRYSRRSTLTGGE
jgi:phage terminase large subunit